MFLEQNKSKLLNLITKGSYKYVFLMHIENMYKNLPS